MTNNMDDVESYLNKDEKEREQLATVIEKCKRFLEAHGYGVHHKDAWTCKTNERVWEEGFQTLRDEVLANQTARVDAMRQVTFGRD